MATAITAAEHASLTAALAPKAAKSARGAALAKMSSAEKGSLLQFAREGGLQAMCALLRMQGDHRLPLVKVFARILKGAAGGDAALLRQANKEHAGTTFKRLAGKGGELGKVSTYVLDKLRKLKEATKGAAGRKRPREAGAGGEGTRAAVPRTTSADAASALTGFADLGGGFASTPAHQPPPSVPPTAAPAPAMVGPSTHTAPRVSAASASGEGRKVKGILSRNPNRRTATTRITWGDGRGGKGEGQVESGVGLVAVVTFSPQDMPKQVMGHGAGDASALQDHKNKGAGGGGQGSSFSQRRKAEGALGTAVLEKAKEVASTQAAVMPYAPPRLLHLGPREEAPAGATKEAAAQESRLKGNFRAPSAEQQSSENNPSLPRDPHMDKGQIWSGFRRGHVPRAMVFKGSTHQASLATLQAWLAPKSAAPVPRAAGAPAPPPPPPMSAVGQANMAGLALTQSRKPAAGGLLGAQPHGASLLGPRSRR